MTFVDQIKKRTYPPTKRSPDDNEAISQTVNGLIYRKRIKVTLGGAIIPKLKKQARLPLSEVA